METVENNKLIAEFLGWTLDDEELKSYRKYINNYFKYSLLSNFKFNSDWNWLIKVVENVFSKEEQIKDDLIFKLNDALLEVNINSLYNACLNCIKWYNENK